MPIAIPGFWMNEQGGELQPAIVNYLNHHPLTPGEVELIRLYLKQWINSPVWRGDLAGELRLSVDQIENSTDISNWLRMADEAGIDPL